MSHGKAEFRFFCHGIHDARHKIAPWTVIDNQIHVHNDPADFMIQETAVVYIAVLAVYHIQNSVGRACGCGCGYGKDTGICHIPGCLGNVYDTAAPDSCHDFSSRFPDPGSYLSKALFRGRSLKYLRLKCNPGFPEAFLQDLAGLSLHHIVPVQQVSLLSEKYHLLSRTLQCAMALDITSGPYLNMFTFKHLCPLL